MIIDSIISEFRPQIEKTLVEEFERWLPKSCDELRQILAYHMGWQGEITGEAAQGKRIRPLITLLCCSAAGGNWQTALPAAAAVEFVHNFSLLHDDIQDRSQTRRGRLTAWVKWGDAMAINAGDALYTIAILSLTGIKHQVSSEAALTGTQILLQACAQLTQGQHLDLAYEKIEDLPTSAYWTMIEGKTAALLSAAAELGALVANEKDENTRQQFHRFGYKLGMAFQVVDDWLGVWGDPKLTGKSAGSDLISRKKTIPILYGLQKKGQFYNRFIHSMISEEETAILKQYLIEEGAQTYTQELAEKLTAEALQSLEDAVVIRNEHYQVLKELSLLLTNRRN